MTKTRNKIVLPLFSPKSKSFKCAPTANEGSSVLTSYRNIGNCSMSYISPSNLFTVYMDIVREFIIYKENKECVVSIGFNVKEIVNFEHLIWFD